MALKNTKTFKPKSQANSVDIRKFRSDIAKLKKLGLVSKRVDARSQQATRHFKSQLKRFENVLSGQAQVLKAPRNIAREYETLDHKFNRLIVPLQKGERAKLVKTEQEHTFIGPTQITTRVQKINANKYGREIKETIPTRKALEPDEFPRGRNIAYYATIEERGKISRTGNWSDLNELKKYLMPYERAGVVISIHWFEHRLAA